MTINLELLAPFVGAIAALASALFVLFKWADEQENSKHEQRSREIRNEIRAEIYRDVLEPNVEWLSQSESQRNTLRRLSGEANDQAVESQDADQAVKSSQVNRWPMALLMM